MSTQIRFTASDSFQRALEELRPRFQFLSDAEIIKLAFSKFYYQEMGYDENGFSPEFQKELDQAIAEFDAGEVEGPFTVDEFFETLNRK